MVLNQKPQMFSIYFPSNFFYPEVQRKWEPVIEKMRLPYQSLSDFMNQQIQSVDFPSANIDIVTQQRGQYDVAYTSGKELEPLIGKELTVKFKLTESYFSYFIIWDQVDTYLHYVNSSMHAQRPLPWMEPINLGFLTDAGFELLNFRFREITPMNIGSVSLNYSATLASYNTFDWRLRYNVFDKSF